MKKKESLDDYELFYMELPQADYLDDIEIQDEIDNPDYDKIQGLSAEQVSQIANDSLGHDKGHKKSSDNDKLFSADTDKNK